MLKVDLFGLEEGINPIKFSFLGDIPLFRQLDVELADRGTVTGMVDKRDEDLFLFSLSMNIPVNLPCRRCLDVFTVDVKADFMLVAMRKYSRDIENYKDGEVLNIDTNQRKIDLEETIREHFLLNLPAHPLCRDSCKGICPGCGAGLNHEDCNCTE